MSREFESQIHDLRSNGGDETRQNDEWSHDENGKFLHLNENRNMLNEAF